MPMPPEFKNNTYWMAALAEFAFWVLVVCQLHPNGLVILMLLGWGFCRYHLGQVVATLRVAREAQRILETKEGPTEPKMRDHG